MDESASKMMHSRIFSTKSGEDKKTSYEEENDVFHPVKRRVMTKNSSFLEMLIILRTSPFASP